MKLIKYTSTYMQYVAIYTAIYGNNHCSQLYLFCHLQRDFLFVWYGYKLLSSLFKNSDDTTGYNSGS